MPAAKQNYRHTGAIGGAIGVQGLAGSAWEACPLLLLLLLVSARSPRPLAVSIGKPPLPLLPDLLTFAFLPPSALTLQVRRIIWKLFALCPTPAAAISADLQQVQASTPAPHFSAHLARQLSAADTAPLLPFA
jgi:hypothetical protein